MTGVVTVRSLIKTFPGPPPVTAVQPADLSIGQGDYVALMGRSGSGKSTLLHLLGLLDRPTAGSYAIDGVETTELSDAERTAFRGQRIGFVFQAFHLLAHRSTIENVALALLYRKHSRRTRLEVSAEALRAVGLSHRLHAFPTTMSGGERQRVAIARAIVTEPSLLLADEPTGNLDSVTAETVLEIFDELNKRGLTLIVATHDAYVASHATRQLHMADGELREVEHNARA